MRAVYESRRNRLEWWDGTIQGVGDTAQEFGFTLLDDAVSADDLRTSFDQVFLDDGYGAGEPVKGVVEGGHATLSRRKQFHGTFVRGS